MSYGLRIGPRVSSVRVPEVHRGRVFTIQDIRPGWQVIDVDDQAVGSVRAAGSSFLTVRLGLLRVAYLPYRAVGAVRDSVVRLNVPRERLADGAWSVRPRSGV